MCGSMWWSHLLTPKIFLLLYSLLDMIDPKTDVATLGLPFRHQSSTKPLSWNWCTSSYSVFFWCHNIRIFMTTYLHTPLIRVALKYATTRESNSVTMRYTHSWWSVLQLASLGLLTGCATYTCFWKVLQDCQCSAEWSMAAQQV